MPGGRDWYLKEVKTMSNRILPLFAHSSMPASSYRGPMGQYRNMCNSFVFI